MPAVGVSRPLTVQSLGSHNVTEEGDVAGTAGLQRDGVDAEMLQHVENGLEPEVLDAALRLLVQRQSEVLAG